MLRSARSLNLNKLESVSSRRLSTLVIGSGAAGLNAAIQLDEVGEKNLAVYTEGARAGTSINTGSDKQTYYKMGLYGAEEDSPERMAGSLFDGGSMHGDLALVESALSLRAFFNLVALGVPFPTDSFGQYIGYKTDHDPSRRATSVGPRTSKMMCESLLSELERRGIELVEKRVAVSLLTLEDDAGAKRACGAVFAVADAGAADDLFEVVLADNVVFAVGGPGGLYTRSVYPKGHTGAIGLALMEGAEAANLAESQYGLASVKFRWNVSGSYMQVVPRFISVDSNGGDEREFLRPFFNTAGEMNTAVFLKGYQWPFDPTKVECRGSSLIDLLVYRETEKLGRRVFLDFTRNSAEFALEELSDEAREYLESSEAVADTPIDRLRLMNPEAIDLYKSHNIDITLEPLEIAVCAQHNNGGLAADGWWESANIANLFPVGEVNGSHGVRRPGGTALNSGQVAGFRVAERVSLRRGSGDFPLEEAIEEASKRLEELRSSVDRPAFGDWRVIRREIGGRMSEFGSHIRSAAALETETRRAWRLYEKLAVAGVGAPSNTSMVDLVEGLRNRQLCFAHAVYLEALLFAARSGVGSRGSSLILDKEGVEAHPALGPEWRFEPENVEFRSKVLRCVPEGAGAVKCEWIDRRPIPESNAWFETVWRDFREARAKKQRRA